MDVPSPTSFSRPESAHKGAFATTHWSVVLLAGESNSSASAEALNQLCATYWFPIYAEIRRRGVSPTDAEDLAQDYFATLLRRSFLAHVSAERGRFRAFLLASLRNFLTDHWDARRAAKRGGGVVPIELDALAAERRLALEPSTDETPDKAFDRRWAAALLDRALRRLEWEQAARLSHFERLKPLLTRPVEAGEYDALAAELSLNANTIAQTVRRLRLRARELMLEEAAHTVAAAGDAERELRELFG